MQPATAPLPSDPDDDLLGDMRRLFATLDPVSEHALLSARRAVAEVRSPRPRSLAPPAIGLAKSANRVTTSSKPDSPA